MLPTKSNHTKDRCVTTSSNCVIWQGPDLSCINLCKGDSVSDVVAKLATELCTIMSELDINNYDISCLELPTVPANIQTLIEILTGRICQLEAGSGSGGGGGTVPACPDNCIVEIAECFYHLSDTTGNQVTTSTLTDYVLLIANRICTIVTEISLLQDQVTQNTNDIESLQVTVNELVNAPAPALPNVNIQCLTNNTSTPMTTAIQTIATELCVLERVLGDNNALVNSIQRQCIGLNTSPVLSGSGLMSGISNWNSNPSTIAATLNNLWLTICDMRSAIQSIQTNCCVTGCAGINVSFTVSVSTTIDITFAGVIPSGFVECNPLGTLISIQGDGYTGSPVRINVPLLVASNGTYNLPIPAGLNVNADFTVSTTLCLTDPSTGSECSSYISYDYTSLLACPVVSLTTPGEGQISVSFVNAFSAPIYYVIQIFDASGTTLMDSVTYSNPAIGTITYLSEGLSSGTVYKVRVQVSTDNVTFTNCDWSSVTTITPACAEISTITSTDITFTAS